MAIAARLIAALTMLATPGLAQAQERPDGPFPWQMDFQNSASLVMDYIEWFSWYTLVIVAVIVVFVLGLLGWCILRFRESVNPVPSRVTHNTMVEVLWTVIPVMILVAIAIPSFKLLYGQYDPGKLYADFDPETTPFLTVKFSGWQWYWDVSYPNDEENAAMGVAEPISVTMRYVGDDKLAEGQVRNLSVTNPAVVPVNTFVRVQVTAEGDAIHALAMPAFGLKEDAVPGRLNETYFKADREGVFYGQCSELCGKDHAFMPLEIRVVSEDQFRTWAAQAVADLPGAYRALAAAIENDKQEQQKIAGR
jgi:cytochrome c oxidase subunit 2